MRISATLEITQRLSRAIVGRLLDAFAKENVTVSNSRFAMSVLSQASNLGLSGRAGSYISMSDGSSAFATAQVKRQLRPEGE